MKLGEETTEDFVEGIIAFVLSRAHSGTLKFLVKLHFMLVAKGLEVRKQAFIHFQSGPCDFV